MSIIDNSYKTVIEDAVRYENIIIYGAQVGAFDLYEYLKALGLHNSIRAFAVTSLEGNPVDIEGVPVICIDELKQFANENTSVLIAVSDKFKGAVEAALSVVGFSHFAMIGHTGLANIWAESDIRLSHEMQSEYLFYASQNEITWLDVERKSDGFRFKYPLITRMPGKQGLDKFLSIDLDNEYKSQLGTYRNLNSLNVVEQDSEYAKTINIYMVTSHLNTVMPDTTINTLFEKSLQAGAALTDDRMADFVDCDGDNISLKNPDYCEMTAMYWIWKNSPGSDYKGLCHYRRHFVLDETFPDILDEFNIDAVLTTPRFVPDGIERYFRDTPVKKEVFDNMLLSVSDLYGEDIMRKASQYFSGYFYYPNNMLIARTEVFDAYCEWLFPVLFEMERRDSESEYVPPKRHIAFAAEMLTSFYFALHKDNLKIAVTDYRFIK